MTLKLDIEIVLYELLPNVSVNLNKEDAVDKILIKETSRGGKSCIKNNFYGQIVHL